jgi:hypothetical protein
MFHVTYSTYISSSLLWKELHACFATAAVNSEINNIL